MQIRYDNFGKNIKTYYEQKWHTILRQWDGMTQMKMVGEKGVEPLHPIYKNGVQTAKRLPH